MRIYIASSWKNQLAVELLTLAIREMGHEVISFVEEEIQLGRELVFDNADWIYTEEGKKKFQFDTDGATKSDLVVYIGPSGKDAMAEVGAAWASEVPVIGFYAKGEGIGLMRLMMRKWCKTADELLDAIHLFYRDEWLPEQ